MINIKVNLIIWKTYIVRIYKNIKPYKSLNSGISNISLFLYMFVNFYVCKFLSSHENISKWYSGYQNNIFEYTIENKN